MSRFEKKPTPAIYIAITASLIAVFIADLATPLGLAVWILYLIPVFLSLYVWRPGVPLYLAVFVSLALFAGYMISRPGENPALPRINRTLGTLTIWILAGVAHQFIRTRLQVRKEEWLQAGQTQLSEQLRGEQSIKDLANRTVHFLADYLDAHAGILYVKQGEVFGRAGGYALPSRGVPEQLGPGEGLAGEASQTGRTIVVHSVPKDYFEISSGLGGSRPQHLLVAPVKADGAVNGVVELAFVHPVFEADLELLDRVAESIGIAIRTAVARARLQQLLEETQRQAQELQVQGEELRVSNEELAEQSRALKESQARLEIQQTELEQTNQQLEEQAKVLEEKTDDLSKAKTGLEHQALELEQASRYKSDFLASMSHELRTPLNSSLILAKLLADNRTGNLTPEQVKYAQTIQSAGNDLLRLITDILDISKIEAGRMELRLEQVPLDRLVEGLRRTFQPLAGDKKLEFEIRVEEGGPREIETDGQKLEQVLKNVISNAIKFTENGKVQMIVQPGEPGWVSFAIKDTGVGIPPEHQELIFEPFRQVDSIANRRTGGTGLGLSISRQLAQLLGGRISVQSEFGKGSRFIVTLPEKHPPIPTPAPAAAPAVPRTPKPSVGGTSVALAPKAQESPSPTKRPSPQMVEDDRQVLTGSRRVVLIVEDDPTFAGILKGLAHELQFQCLVASTADDGVILARQYSPSAVLLDVGLPDNSGLTVLDRLKRDPGTRHIPVHIISAGDHSQTALDMGAVGYMLKPVMRDQLVDAFRSLETRISHHVRRVLVVEDDPVQLDSLRQLLETGDVETVGARSAAESLELLKTMTVDCMVLDLNLPDASGFMLLETLAREETYPFPPVIIYTGRDLSSGEEQRLRRYSKSIIIKGAKSPERLLDEVTLFLHQVISELPEDKQRMLQKASNRDTALEGKRILVVEDDVRNVFALTSVLEPRGAIVQVARNGREALEMLEAAGPDPAGAIHLVFMDIMMPEMDGLTATREIRRRERWKKLPIIALTAKAMKADQEACLAAGANDYMPKPLDVEKLLSLARVWVSR